jgi:hypothetical protein
LQATLDKISELNGGKEIITRSELDEQREPRENGTPKAEQSKPDEEKPDGGFSDVSFEDL